MIDPIPAISALSAATVYIAKTAYELVLKQRSNGSSERNHCHAQEVQTTMQSTMDTQTLLLQDIKQSQSDTRDGVRELVTLSRRM